MTPTAPVRLLTAEEFAVLPQPADGSQQELVQGIVVPLPPPGVYHSPVCIETGERRLGSWRAAIAA